jgi:signal transduction histidine kinase
MMAATPEQLERHERRLERLIAAVPYLLLLISTTLAVLTGPQDWGDRLVALGLAAAAAVWMWLMSVRRTPGPTYVIGLIVLIALLSIHDTWFASFFAFTGYLHSWQYLRGSWRFVGVTATAAISITAYMGGPPEPNPPAILTYLFFIAAIVALVGVFSFLGDVTSERSTERKNMVAQLQETIQENAGLHAQLLLQAREAGILDERQRMAREIHDTLAQGLAGIVTQLQAARRAGESGATEVWLGHVDNATRLARESLDEARRSVAAITPGQLESAHLPEAIATVASEWADLSGVRVEVSTTGTARPLHPEVEVTLLRIAQEALSNIAKHASASRVGITLSYMDDVITLDVRDDGAGFEPVRARDRGGYGLTSMHQRANRLAGTVEIESEPGSGTAISATIPATTGVPPRVPPRPEEGTRA